MEVAVNAMNSVDRVRSANALEPVALRRAGWRGFRFGPLPEDLDDRLDHWLASGQVEERTADVFKHRRVWRIGEFVVKFSRSKGRLRDRLRSSPALRAALRARDLPVATPRPLLALETAGASSGQRLGVLVTEYVRGVLLEDCLRDDEYAMRRFTRFLAVLHRSGTIHGDFHWRNQIWSAERDDWFLLDLEGLRHPLRKLLPARLVVRQWARLCHCLRRSEELRPHFERFFDEARITGCPERAWRSVREHARGIDRRQGSLWRFLGQGAVASGFLGRPTFQRGPAE